MDKIAMFGQCVIRVFLWGNVWKSQWNALLKIGD